MPLHMLSVCEITFYFRLKELLVFSKCKHHTFNLQLQVNVISFLKKLFYFPNIITYKVLSSRFYQFFQVYLISEKLESSHFVLVLLQLI